MGKKLKQEKQGFPNSIKRSKNATFGQGDFVMQQLKLKRLRIKLKNDITGMAAATNKVCIG